MTYEIPLDVYEVLGVPQTASNETIDAAYKNLSRRHHPDRNGGTKESTEKFQQLSEAYSILKNPNHRKSLDDALANTMGNNVLIEDDDWGIPENSVPDDDWGIADDNWGTPLSDTATESTKQDSQAIKLDVQLDNVKSTENGAIADKPQSARSNSFIGGFVFGAIIAIIWFAFRHPAIVAILVVACGLGYFCYALARRWDECADAEMDSET